MVVCKSVDAWGKKENETVSNLNGTRVVGSCAGVKGWGLEKLPWKFHIHNRSFSKRFIWEGWRLTWRRGQITSVVGSLSFGGNPSSQEKSERELIFKERPIEQVSQYWWYPEVPRNTGWGTLAWISEEVSIG